MNNRLSYTLQPSKIYHIGNEAYKLQTFIAEWLILQKVKCWYCGSGSLSNLYEQVCSSKHWWSQETTDPGFLHLRNWAEEASKFWQWDELDDVLALGVEE